MLVWFFYRFISVVDFLEKRIAWEKDVAWIWEEEDSSIPVENCWRR